MVRTTEIQDSSHDGYPSHFTKWRLKAGSHNVDLGPLTHWRSQWVHTMEIPSQFTKTTYKRMPRIQPLPHNAGYN